jgi:hypothetical protein
MIRMVLGGAHGKTLTAHANGDLVDGVAVIRVDDIVVRAVCRICVVACHTINSSIKSLPPYHLTLYPPVRYGELRYTIDTNSQVVCPNSLK